MSSKFKAITGTVAFAALLSVCAPVFAQSDDGDPEMRIERLENQLRQLTGGAPELDVEASSIKELLEKVGGDHPELLERVLDDDGEIRRFVNLYVGDEDVRFLEGIDTPLKDGEVVVILPAVAGG